ncbi:MAG: hypothetical protein IKX03_04610 [Bacteroidales bacterium]|nr:hypothetical protein [Bacteroidales bacterium]
MNYHTGDLTDLTATACVLDMYGKEVWSRSMALDNLPEDSTAECFAPEIPEGITEVYFIKLALTDENGTVLSDNFYWQGVEEGNWQALRRLPQPSLSIHRSRAGKGLYKVRIENRGKTPALMLRLKAVDSGTQDLVLPIWYSDNYFSIMPGESKEVEVRVDASNWDKRIVFAIDR